VGKNCQKVIMNSVLIAEKDYNLKDNIFTISFASPRLFPKYADLRFFVP
jgi:hypothetical protein